MGALAGDFAHITPWKRQTGEARFNQNAMKNTISLAALAAALVIGAGCQSSRNHASNDLQSSEQAPKYKVTVESIPASRLSPTSRDGDQPSAVYSSNIIAVYVNEVGKTNGGITNATSIILPEKQK
jgi:hypothetical protein